MTTAETNKLITQWVPLAHKLAREYIPAFRIGTPWAEDVHSAALEGLVRGVQSFDEARGHFYVHVENRIRWAICGHLASGNMLMGRGARTNARSRGEEPPMVLSIDAMEGFDDRTPGDGPAIFDEVAQAEQRSQLRLAMRQLPRRTADAVRMYYFEEKTLKEVGAAFSVSRQRAEQIIKDGIAQLNGSLQRAPREIPIKAKPPEDHARGRSWGPPDENGFSPHYLCNGTGQIRVRRKGKAVRITRMHVCTPCSGRGYRRLAEPLARAV